MSTSRWKLGRYILANILVFILFLVVIEGLASYLLFMRDVLTTTPLAERLHTQYDPDLGWVNIPDINIPDMYGPDISLRTNSQGFRNDYNFDKLIPAGKKRIICSGDSFTLGYGVDNHHTWCQQLAALDTRIETVNMAQGGYGLDQAYLWYMRDGIPIDHDMLILAFITEDIYRMQRNKFIGYSKPVLAIENGVLVVRNIPVPRTSYIFSFFTSIRDSFSKLRTVEFVNRVVHKISTDDVVRQNAGSGGNAETRVILMKLFQELAKSNHEFDRKLVLVYLPTRYELSGKPPEQWMDFIQREALNLEIPFINIMTEFQSMKDDEIAKLFIPYGNIKYPKAAGHLNEAGNKVVAEIIHGRLENGLLFTK